MNKNLPTDTIGTCVSDCGVGWAVVSGVCEQCDASCKECTAGLDPLKCSACFPGSVLYPPPLRTCVPGGCPAGYYIGPGSECIACDTANCLTCYGPGSTSCLTCHQTPVAKILKADTSECKVTCPSNYYVLSGKCYPCDATCATCNGPTRTNCLTCLPGKLR